MKVLLTSLLLLTLIAPGYTQVNMKLSGENFLKSERIVKNAPFSAEAVSENVQVLADGNRITRRTTSRLYRDSEGRYRREDMPKQIGLPGAVIDMPESILILDPVSGYRFQLNPKNKTGRVSQFRPEWELKSGTDFEFKMKLDFKLMEKDLKQLEKNAGELEKAAEAQKAVEAEIAAIAGEKAAMRAARAAMQAERAKQLADRQRELEDRKREIVTKAEIENRDKTNTRTEQLGVQNVEGVEAEGTRTTTTIPAGSIGNEREIEVVYEKWYSNELQMIVFSRHLDPRFGEQTYRLTNINRSEPPMSLFSPPTDYQISVGGYAPIKPVFPTVPKVPAVDKKPPRAPLAPAGAKKPH